MDSINELNANNGECFLVKILIKIFCLFHSLRIIFKRVS